jgi:hypothetical protein
MNVSAARGALRDDLFCLGQIFWHPFQRETRLKPDRDLDWFLFAEDSKTGRELVVVRYRITDEMMDTVMGLEGEPVQLPGIEHAWRSKHLRGETVFFRFGASMLGIGPGDAVSGAVVSSLLAEATPDRRPAVLLWLRGAGLEKAHLREKGVREVRVTVASTEDDAARVELDIDMEREADAEALMEGVHKSTEDKSFDEVLGILEEHMSMEPAGKHVRVVSVVDGGELKRIFVALKYGNGNARGRYVSP